jgi:tRNA pseudouridine55 synthase
MTENGILNINKPQGMTSHDVVARVRRILGIKRVGHTGTLDPMATGVLPICIGSAARIMEYLDIDFKTYRCKVLLGKITDTQDIWGEVLEERSASDIGEQQIIEAFSKFHGIIEQKPPMYSAIKVNGKKLYEYARKGETVEVKTRKICVKKLTIENIDIHNQAEKTVEFTVQCSKGTYIRTICQDVGEILGCGATMAALERTESGRFTIADSVDLEKLQAMTKEEIEREILPADFPLVHFGQILLDEVQTKNFIDGRHILMNKCDIIKEPEFKHKQAEFTIKEDYKEAYNMYQKTATGKHFLGVAFYNKKYKKLVADKVLSRGEIIESI